MTRMVSRMSNRPFARDRWLQEFIDDVFPKDDVSAPVEPVSGVQTRFSFIRSIRFFSK